MGDDPDQAVCFQALCREASGQEIACIQPDDPVVRMGDVR